jgi:predicted SAM-dependent methyltransferase
MTESGGKGRIHDYVASREQHAVKGLPRGRAANLLRTVTSHDMRAWAKLNGTTLLVPLSKRKAQSIAAGRKDLKLHLGCGPNHLDGWVNVDILGMHPDVYWDLRRGVPFPDECAQAAFLEHVLEHFSLGDVVAVLKECHRVLAPGGVVRIGVPDFGRYLESYSGDRSFIEELRPGRPTALLAVGEVALNHGHRSVWDGPTLVAVLEEAGFVEAQARKFGESALDPVPDTPMREPESVYAEAVKPS